MTFYRNDDLDLPGLSMTVLFQIAVSLAPRSQTLHSNAETLLSDILEFTK